jgi:hypothetical protein
MNVNPKVVASGAAGALTVLVVYLLSLVGVDVPTEVAAAITVIIAFVAGYLRPQGDWASRD